MDLSSWKPVAARRDPEPKFAARSYQVTDGKGSCYVNMNQRIGLSGRYSQKQRPQAHQYSYTRRKTMPIISNEQSVNRTVQLSSKKGDHEVPARLYSRSLIVYFILLDSLICSTAVNCGKGRPNHVRLKARAGHSAEFCWRSGCTMMCDMRQ
jgi:hypothetical protein